MSAFNSKESAGQRPAAYVELPSPHKPPSLKLRRAEAYAVTRLRDSTAWQARRRAKNSRHSIRFNVDVMLYVTHVYHAPNARGNSHSTQTIEVIRLQVNGIRDSRIEAYRSC